MRSDAAAGRAFVFGRGPYRASLFGRPKSSRHHASSISGGSYRRSSPLSRTSQTQRGRSAISRLIFWRHAQMLSANASLLRHARLGSDDRRLVQFARLLLSLDADRSARPARRCLRGLDQMTTTIGTLLAAHVAGQSLTATIEETYARIEKHNDPALFITIRPKSEALAIAERIQASGPAGKPLYGVPFAAKDNIDVDGLPTTAAFFSLPPHPPNN